LQVGLHGENVFSEARREEGGHVANEAAIFEVNEEAIRKRLSLSDGVESSASARVGKWRNRQTVLPSLEYP